MTEVTTDHKEPVNVYRAEKLRGLMDRYFVSSKELAELLDTTPSAVVHWLNGNCGIYTSNELAIAYFFGVPREEFYRSREDITLPHLTGKHRPTIERFMIIRDRIIDMNVKHRVPTERESDWMVDNGLPVRYMKERGMFGKHHLGSVNKMGPVLKKHYGEGEPQIEQEPTREPMGTLVGVTPEEQEQIRRAGPGQLIPLSGPVENIVPLMSDYDRLNKLLEDAEALRKRLDLKWIATSEGKLLAQVKFNPGNRR